MTIDDKAFADLCELAQLALSDQEKAECLQKISALIAGIERVDDDLIAHLTPLANPEDIHQRLRDDIAHNDNTTSPSALSEYAQDELFLVPKVIE